MGGVARAFRGVISARLEAVGVVGIEAVGDGEAEDGGTDETVSMGDGCLDGWWGFIAVWGCAGDVGWVVGGGVVPSDAGPHRHFGFHFRFGYLWGFLRDCDPLDFCPASGPEPGPFT